MPSTAIGTTHPWQRSQDVHAHCEQVSSECSSLQCAVGHTFTPQSSHSWLPSDLEFQHCGHQLAVQCAHLIEAVDACENPHPQPSQRKAQALHHALLPALMTVSPMAKKPPQPLHLPSDEVVTTEAMVVGGGPRMRFEPAGMGGHARDTRPGRFHS